ncbi:hypothetical protein [Methylocapsa sp. S129]|uniref:hypothetical protein n=1 Tax=Methylocapsa sp. S129 TaxID=1641869 RepID=UPI00131BF761|nr:hypothetical protein [Methylocapsa sp. S129]
MAKTREHAGERRCAYCGGRAFTGDHVVSRALYPPSSGNSRHRRIKVPACVSCNNGWSDDEAHFRTVMLLAGDPTPAVRELWDGKVRRSFTQPDGRKRARDLFNQFVPVTTPDGPRHAIYPGRDERVVRIVRKIVRGLCHHHGLLSPVLDEQVQADIHRSEVPHEFLAQMTFSHAEESVLQYRFGVVDEPEIHSGWLLTFFNRTPFLCIVFRSAAARRQFEARSVATSEQEMILSNT